MSAQSPGAYGISMLIHGLAAGLVVFFSYASSHVTDDTPKVFELVAGEGDNYGATEAPALGSPGGVTVPTPPVETAPAPVQPEPMTALPSPIQSAPEKPTHTTQKPIDLVKELNRVQARREKRLEAQYQKHQEAERKRELEEARKAAARGTRIDAEGIREGVIGGSKNNKTGGAGGKALTREQMSELDAYFELLKMRIRESYTPPEDITDNSLSAQIEFMVAADGSLSGFRIVRSSGNHAVDQSMIEACEHTSPIGPRPDGQSERERMTFRVRDEESP
jgi:colicin import membrane protein